MNRIRVAVNGYGVIGKRVADAVRLQDDMVLALAAIISVGIANEVIQQPYDGTSKQALKHKHQHGGGGLGQRFVATHGERGTRCGKQAARYQRGARGELVSEIEARCHADEG